MFLLISGARLLQMLQSPKKSANFSPSPPPPPMKFFDTRVCSNDYNTAMIHVSNPQSIQLVNIKWKNKGHKIQYIYKINYTDTLQADNKVR